jgi:hypothetical protein
MRHNTVMLAKHASPLALPEVVFNIPSPNDPWSDPLNKQTHYVRMLMEYDEFG